MSLWNKIIVCGLLAIIATGAAVLKTSAEEIYQGQTYSHQNININKPKDIPSATPPHFIPLNELPVASSQALENLNSPEQAVSIPPLDKIEPAAGNGAMLEDLKVTSAGDFVVVSKAKEFEPSGAQKQRIEIIDNTNDQSASMDEVEINQASMPFANGTYLLSGDDKINIKVYGEKELSGDFTLNSDGTISMPLIGLVNLLNLSPQQAETVIVAKLQDGYIKEPNVTVKVIEAKPFYIMGEVRTPGSYPYVNGMNILQAVAISGGFTYRANKKSIDVLRARSAKSEPVPVDPEESILPGDIIFVRERFF